MTTISSLGPAEKAIAWIERCCAHTKGRWAGQPLILEGWQRDIVKGIFGPQHDGARVVRSALIGVPRKNGKSTLGAALALYLLIGDGEPGAEVYSVAADREQARIVFGIASEMVRASDLLSSRAKVRRNWIEVPGRNSIYRVLSSDAPTKHGLNPHGVIFDELHAQPNRELWDVLTSGQAARRQPLTVAITTAGFDRETVCWEQYDYGRKVNSGIVEDPSFFFRWWGVEDGESWEDPDVWRRVNPNYGVSVAPDFLQSEVEKARHQPARQNAFRRLYLNEWTQASDRWLDLSAWDATAGMVDEIQLKGREACGGLDLASVSDLTALCWDFPDSDGHQAIWRFFTPKDNLPKLDSRTAGQASVWSRQGFLTVTDGNVLDYEAVFRQIDRDAKTFKIRRIAFDRWGSPQFVQRLLDAGLEVAEMGQGFASMSPPAKEFERLVLDGKYRHGGNPVMRWMVDNVVARQDPAGNIKPDKDKSTEKIDGVVAAVMALDAAMRVAPRKSSVYEERGMQFA